MFKRIWILLIMALALGIALSACGDGDLASDLTPIPTLPPGDEPPLVDALQAGADTATDAGAPDDGGEMDQAQLVTLGEELFTAACSGCHGAQDGAGPAFPGMAERAATRVDGQSAEDYLYEAIVNPGAHIVDGYNNIMPMTYGDDYTDTELDAMVAYIMAESGTGDDMDTAPTDEPEPTDTPDTPEPDGDTATDTDTDDDSDADTDAGADADSSDDDTSDQLVGDPEAGEALFGPTCGGCHGAQDGVGPALTGMGERAATRVDGQSAEDYLYEAIVDPGAYVVEGYNNIMPPTYGDDFSDQEIWDMVAYMLTQ